MKYFGNEPHTLSSFNDRLCREARRRYPRHTAKMLARDAGVTPRTAESWLTEGRSPQADTLTHIIKKWGRDALLTLFSPEIQDHAATLEREAAEAEAKARELKAKLAAIRSESGVSQSMV